MKKPHVAPFWLPAAMTTGPLFIALGYLCPINPTVTLACGMGGAILQAFGSAYLYKRLERLEIEEHKRSTSRGL